MTAKFVDIHHHLLWGLDDGPRKGAETIQMINAAIADGVGAVVATPHVTPGVEPFDFKAYTEKLNAARQYCKKNNLAIDILSGAEILYTSYAVPMLRDGRIPTIGNNYCALIEFWRDVRWPDLVKSVDELYRAGYVAIIAHIERYDCFTLLPGRAAALRRDVDVRFQVNCNTILNPRGPFTKRLVRKLFEADAIDFIATDAHNITTRPTNMRKAYLKLCQDYGRERADRVTRFELD